MDLRTWTVHSSHYRRSDDLRCDHCIRAAGKFETLLRTSPTPDVSFSQTGRMGEQAPAEHIIATIVSLTGAFALPLSIPFIHRYSRGVLVRSIVLLTFVTTASVAVFSMRSPFDTMHQKRLFVMHMENVRCSVEFNGDRPAY